MNLDKSLIPKIARYLAVIRELRLKSTPEEYIAANTLSWELAMTLPAELYKEIAQVILQPSPQHNLLSIVITVRKMSGLNDEFTTENIIYHAPGAGLQK